MLKIFIILNNSNEKIRRVDKEVKGKVKENSGQLEKN